MTCPRRVHRRQTGPMKDSVPGGLGCFDQSGAGTAMALNTATGMMNMPSGSVHYSRAETIEQNEMIS